jgi:hypothetical protein
MVQAPSVETREEETAMAQQRKARKKKVGARPAGKPDGGKAMKVLAAAARPMIQPPSVRAMGGGGITYFERYRFFNGSMLRPFEASFKLFAQRNYVGQLGPTLMTGPIPPYNGSFGFPEDAYEVRSVRIWVQSPGEAPCDPVEFSVTDDADRILDAGPSIGPWDDDGNDYVAVRILYWDDSAGLVFTHAAPLADAVP